MGTKRIIWGILLFEISEKKAMISHSESECEPNFQLLKNKFLCFAQNVLLVNFHQLGHTFDNVYKYFDEYPIIITQG